MKSSRLVQQASPAAFKDCASAQTAGVCPSSPHCISKESKESYAFCADTGRENLRAKRMRQNKMKRDNSRRTLVLNLIENPVILSPLLPVVV